MLRTEYLLNKISKQDLGIEIAPYHSPLAAKRDGYNCLILDVFDTATLREKGSADAHVDQTRIKDIEIVDFIGSATELASLVPEELHGTFDYVLSSHNFEHLANPIRFLQACEKILKTDGVIRMAVPDGRACFDYYRPITFLGDWLAAYGSNRERPTREQVFSLHAYSAIYAGNKGQAIAFKLDSPLKNILVSGNLQAAYNTWLSDQANNEYMDAHCTIMTPTSLRLLVEECRQLGLIRLEIEDISEVNGFEFYVKLKNPEPGAISLLSDAAFSARRTQLLRKLMTERQISGGMSLQIKFKRLISKVKRHLSFK